MSQRAALLYHDRSEAVLATLKNRVTIGSVITVEISGFSLFMKKSVQIISLILGLALFAYLIKQTGLETLAQYMKMMGWGFAFIVALSALRNLARAASWYYSIGPSCRNVGYWSLMNVMLAGEAI